MAQKTVRNHLKKSEYKNKLDVLVPHVLTLWTEFLSIKIFKTNAYWWWKVVEVESWWAAAKGGLMFRRVLLCVFSNMSCAPTAKLLIGTCTVNTWTVIKRQSPRSGQLWPIGVKMYPRYPGSVRPHTSIETCQKRSLKKCVKINTQFFAKSNGGFYESRIMKLP